MRKIVVCLFIFPLVFANAQSVIDLKISKLLTIGAGESGSPEYLFTYPGFVATDTDLNIFVAE